MSDYRISGTDLTAVADAIRTKGGTSLPLSFPDGFVSAVEDISSGGGSTLITKIITANGTYNASSDNADGYSSVTVNVISNMVTGTFQADVSEKGAAKSISIPYSGMGYPIALIIFPTGGMAKSGSDFYTTVQQYAIGQFAMSKADMSATPTYNQNDEKNYATVCSNYKNSASDATNYSVSGNARAYALNIQGARATSQNAARFTDSTTLSVYIASTSYGFMAGIEYTYMIVYSEP